MDMNHFADISQQTKIESDPFIQFIKERRSHRHFQDKPIPREYLEILVDVGRYAPTGSNVQNTEIILYTDRERISKVSDLTGEYFRWIEERVKKKLSRLEAAGKRGTNEYNFTARSLGMADRFEATKAEGKDPLFYDAPCVMIFHSPEQTSTPKDNAVLIAHTIALTARTMGLETCYIGLIEPAANYYPPLKEEFALPEGHKIFYTMIMGYPRLNYLKTVDRKPIKTRWL
jgi:nitroreductase